jgi:hypothetical protein
MVRSARAAAVLSLLLWTACAAAPPPGARVVPSEVDTDDGAFDVTVRLPAKVRPGTTVEVSVFVKGRRGIATYDESAIDFSINGRGLHDARITAVAGEVFTSGFLGEGGTIFARGRPFGPGTRLGFTARFDIAPDAVMRELQFQVHASAFQRDPRNHQGQSFVRNYVAEFEP